MVHHCHCLAENSFGEGLGLGFPRSRPGGDSVGEGKGGEAPCAPLGDDGEQGLAHPSQKARKTGCLSINLLVLPLTEGCRGGRSLSGTPCSLCPVPLAESQEFATGSVWCMEVHTEPSGESGVSAAGTGLFCSPEWTPHLRCGLVHVRHSVLMFIDSMTNSSTDLPKKWLELLGMKRWPGSCPGVLRT